MWLRFERNTESQKRISRFNRPMIQILPIFSKKMIVKVESKSRNRREDAERRSAFAMATAAAAAAAARPGGVIVPLICFFFSTLGN